jgi:hypothetical protein
MSTSPGKKTRMDRDTLPSPAKLKPRPPQSGKKGAIPGFGLAPTECYPQ